MSARGLTRDSWNTNKGKGLLSKRFYILFVARGEDGQLRKIPIPAHYLYVIVVGALIGVLGLTGLASSYVRMLLKVSSYNELRAEREDLKTRYTHLEQASKERDIQVASLGSLASEVSSLYGLKTEPELLKTAASDKVEGTPAQFVARSPVHAEDCRFDGRDQRWPVAWHDSQRDHSGLDSSQFGAESLAC